MNTPSIAHCGTSQQYHPNLMKNPMSALSRDKTIPRISVIVPCRNEQTGIEAFVRDVLAQQQPAGGFEVIIADGMSDDGTREILARLAQEDSRLRIIDNPGRIVSMGLNTAIRLAQGTVILRMDAHTRYAPDYICQCLTVLQQTAADNVGGPWVAHGTGFIGEAIAATFSSPFTVGGARGHDPQYEGIVDTVYLGCWPRAVFERIGFFDEELVRNQDDEFNLRLTRAGGKIWQSPSIKSWYEPRNSLRALYRQYAQYGYWKVRVIQKHRIPASIRHLIPGGFVLALLILPLLALWWPVTLWCWLGLVTLYSASAVAAAAFTATRHGWSLFPLLPIVAACYHTAYGYGFLRGFLDCVILRRHPGNAYKTLTRDTHRQLPLQISGEH
ncbi:MAG: glycosyltransferase family 2 protein [Candidatus Binatia bacterium]